MFRVASVCLALWPCLAAGQDMHLSGVLIDGEHWQQVAEGFKFTEGPAADHAGNLFFTDIPNSRIHKLDSEGRVTVFAENTGNTNGLMFGPDGRLYGCANGKQQIVAYAPDGTVSVIVEGVQSNDLVVNADGAIWFTDPPNKQVWYVSPSREKKVVASGFTPNGIILWADGGTLVVTDSADPVLWTFRVEGDGSLSAKEPYYGPLQVPPGKERPGSDGMTIDRQGRLYVTTSAGLQMFDPTGRLGGTIAKPQQAGISNVCFGGPESDTLFVTSVDKVFKRKTQAAGVHYAKRK